MIAHQDPQQLARCVYGWIVGGVVISGLPGLPYPAGCSMITVEIARGSGISELSRLQCEESPTVH